MTINQIKSNLSILHVLQHFGLRPDQHLMIPCPFHQDDKPSMKIYPKTNTAFCFAASCNIQSVDVIDFIMNIQQCSKHQAILYAKDLCANHQPSNQLLHNMTTHNQLAEQFNTYRKALQRHKLAQQYCQDRKLDWKSINIGYKSRRSPDRWGRGAIIFPLLDQQGNIVSLYGRGITGSSHFYQKNRSGLFPAYPHPNSTIILFTEAIIDVATLLAVDLRLDVALISTFGANGLTDEHLKALALLNQLQEVVFAFDADPAGDKATAQHAATVAQQFPQITVSK
ncbi:MAG: CHC2 zinc finger domain-containing protein, partial [Bacteroidota bacterium]